MSARLTASELERILDEMPRAVEERDRLLVALLLLAYPSRETQDC